MCILVALDLISLVPGVVVPHCKSLRKQVTLDTAGHFRYRLDFAGLVLKTMDMSKGENSAS